MALASALFSDFAGMPRAKLGPDNRKKDTQRTEARLMKTLALLRGTGVQTVTPTRRAGIERDVMRLG